jgi:hypothetical protein
MFITLNCIYISIRTRLYNKIITYQDKYYFIQLQKWYLIHIIIKLQVPNENFNIINHTA